MQNIITKEKFREIFKKPMYRKKLDKMILNFFGLEANQKEDVLKITNEDVLLEFIVMINTDYLLKIIVKDTKKMFTTSKKFYLNFSFQKVKKYHELLMPCYWEIYCPYALENKKKNPKLLLIASLLACKNIQEVTEILEELKVFQKKEIEEILNIVENEN